MNIYHLAFLSSPDYQGYRINHSTSQPSTYKYESVIYKISRFFPIQVLDLEHSAIHGSWSFKNSVPSAVLLQGQNTAAQERPAFLPANEIVLDMYEC